MQLYKNDIAQTTALYPSYVAKGFRNPVDGGYSAIVETCTIAGTTYELDYLPLQGGTQTVTIAGVAAIIKPWGTSLAAGQVSFNYELPLIQLATADNGKALSVTYDAVGSVQTADFVNQLEKDIVEHQHQITDINVQLGYISSISKPEPTKTQVANDLAVTGTISGTSGTFATLTSTDLYSSGYSGYSGQFQLITLAQASGNYINIASLNPFSMTAPATGLRFQCSPNQYLLMGSMSGSAITQAGLCLYAENTSGEPALYLGKSSNQPLILTCSGMQKSSAGDCNITAPSGYSVALNASYDGAVNITKSQFATYAKPLLKLYTTQSGSNNCTKMLSLQNSGSSVELYAGYSTSSTYASWRATGFNVSYGSDTHSTQVNAGAGYDVTLYTATTGSIQLKPSNNTGGAANPAICYLTPRSNNANPPDNTSAKLTIQKYRDSGYNSASLYFGGGSDNAFTLNAVANPLSISYGNGGSMYCVRTSIAYTVNHNETMTLKTGDNSGNHMILSTGTSATNRVKLKPISNYTWVENYTTADKGISFYAPNSGAFKISSNTNLAATETEMSFQEGAIRASWMDDGGYTYKLGFFNTAPIAKTTSTTDLKDSLINYGLVTASGATPLNLDGGALTAGSTNSVSGYATNGTSGLNTITSFKTADNTDYLMTISGGLIVGMELI